MVDADSAQKRSACRRIVGAVLAGHGCVDLPVRQGNGFCIACASRSKHQDCKSIAWLGAALVKCRGQMNFPSIRQSIIASIWQMIVTSTRQKTGKTVDCVKPEDVLPSKLGEQSFRSQAYRVVQNGLKMQDVLPPQLRVVSKGRGQSRNVSGTYNSPEPFEVLKMGIEMKQHNGCRREA